MWGQPFCSRNVAFQEEWAIIWDRNQPSLNDLAVDGTLNTTNQHWCLDLYFLVAFPEGLASHQGFHCNNFKTVLHNALANYTVYISQTEYNKVHRLISITWSTFKEKRGIFSLNFNTRETSHFWSSWIHSNKTLFLFIFSLPIFLSHFWILFHFLTQTTTFL